MRRNDREVKDFNDIVSIIKKCDVCRLALHDVEYPYILPLNFGVQVSGENVTLYFHGAAEGKKYELIQKNNKVSFEVDCSHKLVTDKNAGNCTMEYESVIGYGTIEFVNDDEKIQALNTILEHYHVDKDFKLDETAAVKTVVLKLVVSGMTGKRRMVINS